jgi:hypothetical protein
MVTNEDLWFRSCACEFQRQVSKTLASINQSVRVLRTFCLVGSKWDWIFTKLLLHYV